MSWRPLLRIAWRDALRSKGRSALVLVLIALPVLAVTAADVAIATSDADRVEVLDRDLGSADALLEAQRARWVAQGFDPWVASMSDGVRKAPASAAQVERALGRDATVLPLVTSQTRIRTAKGVADAGVTATDWSSTMTDGLTRLVSGRYPEAPDEVAVNQALRDRGAVVDGTLTLEDGTALTVVGTVESTSTRTFPSLVGGPDFAAVPADPGNSAYLLDAGGVDWDDVVALNKLGVTVTSRDVLTDPPPASVLTGRYAGLDQGGSVDSGTLIAIVALVVTMVLIEVVLLAGPAFAVGARRQSRTMALMAASGGTPSQSRRLVLASAVVLGSAAALVGAVLGVLVGIAILPLVQRHSDSWLGPLDIPWLHIAGVIVFGLVAALLAALVPATIASRQDVVAVLAGRRGDGAPSRRTPLLGVVVLAAGAALAAFGSWANGSTGSLLIALAAIVCVLGMLLVVPLVVALVARLARRLPLPLRFAARDAARHRTRTVPAVAAVAATVAGVVALGIATASDAAENRETYEAAMPDGAASITAATDFGESSPVDLGDVARRLAASHPTLEMQQIRGVGYGGPGEPYVEVDAGSATYDYRSGFGAEVLADALPPFVDPPSASALAAAERALAAGQAVVLVSDDVKLDRVRLTATWSDDQTGETVRRERTRWPAHVLRVPSPAPALAVLPSAAFEKLSVQPRTMGIYLPGPIDSSTQQDLTEEAAAISGNTSVYVERGYVASDDDVIIQLVLGALGAVLMLGGTLTATFLALSDARPDLATLSAVGAAPRTRRLVAAAYAVLVAFVGAVLGAVVGAIPGLAIARVLTISSGYGDGSATMGPFLDVPWLLILGLVLGLPVLTALVVGLVSRSRLPLTARLT